MHINPRTGPIEKIVVHVNVGPEVEGGAAGLARYLNQIDGGYHQIADDHNLVTAAPDNLVVWGASGMNSRGLHVCCIGFANQSPQQWLDAYSRGELDVAARAVASWCRTYGIPVRRLSPAEVKTNGIKGICGHVDVTAAFGGGNNGHYDPGTNFPWTLFLTKVAQILTPAPAPPPKPPTPPKVKPARNPPLVIHSRDELACPTGGAWLLDDNGGIIGVGGAPYRGSPHEDKAQLRVGEVWAQIDAPTPGQKNVKGAPASYVCVTSDGDKSVY